MVEAVTALRERPGRDVDVMGSAQLVRSLLEADLVDEINLMIEPIVLGGGKSIFPADGRPASSSSCQRPPRRPACRSAGTSERADRYAGQQAPQRDAVGV